MAMFDKRCSKVLEGLYIGGEFPAKDLSTLQSHGITHIVNCVGWMYPEFFADQIVYKTFYLKDTPQEDIACVLHDALDFIEQARCGGGRVLVHCSQGVSRSATLVLGYCIWKLDKSYDVVFDHVKKIRCIVSPNVGFQLALLQWQKRRTLGVKHCFVSYLGPHCSEASGYIVPKAASVHTWQALDSRGVFMIQTTGRLYIWVGSHACQALIQAADGVAGRICRYDYTTPVTVAAVREGQEPEALIAALAPPPDACLPEAEARFLALPRHRDEYDADFALLGSAAPRATAGSVSCGGESLRSEDQAHEGGCGRDGAGRRSASGAGDTPHRPSGGRVPPLWMGASGKGQRHSIAAAEDERDASLSAMLNWQGQHW